MTTDPQLERIVRSWLEPGLTTLTDDVLDPVLDQLPATPQRRPVPPLRRIRTVRPIATLSIAAAAAVIVAIVGISLATRPAQPIVGVAPTGLPWFPPSPSSGCGALEAGHYGLDDGTVVVSATVPNGWYGTQDVFHVEKADCTTSGKVRLQIVPIDAVFADACEWEGSAIETQTPAEAVAALAEQQGHEPLVPTSTTLDGYPASRFKLTAAFEPADCTFGKMALWQPPGEAEDSGRVAAMVPNETVTVYVVDVDGTALGVAAIVNDQFASSDDVAELNTIVESLRFQPGEATSVSPRPVESASPDPIELASSAPVESPSLPLLALPGAFYSPAGEYGFESHVRASSGMHKFTEDGSREVADLKFSVLCDPTEWDEPTQKVNVAGFDGVYAEPYEPPVTFTGPDGDETTRAYALRVGERTLCVFLTWHETTTAEELDALLQIVETIRAEHIQNGRLDSVRVVFTLDEGWDVG